MYPENLTIEPTKKTPRIILEPGRIFITGRSIPENSNIFYQPVHEWISRYMSEWKGTTDIILAFEFINTTSIRWIYTILKEVAEIIYMLNSQVKISWYYEEGDEDMYDLGSIISTLVRCPFRIIKVEDIDKYEFRIQK